LSRVGKKGFAYIPQEKLEAEGWLTSAAHVISLVIDDPLNPYYAQCTHLVVTARMQFGVSQDHISSVIGILEYLLQDIDAGLIGTLADRVRAEVFDDFLDHAESYYKRGLKFSGAIAGVVFEDATRRIAKKHDVRATSVEDIISELVKKRVLTETKAKRARSAAHVRTKATHANWDEFDLPDVQNCIQFTREMIESHLSAGA